MLGYQPPLPPSAYNGRGPSPQPPSSGRSGTPPHRAESPSPGQGSYATASNVVPTHSRNNSTPVNFAQQPSNGHHNLHETFDTIQLVNGSLQGTEDELKQYLVRLVHSIRASAYDPSHLLCKLHPFLQQVHQRITASTDDRANVKTFNNDVMSQYILRVIIPAVVRIILSHSPSSHASIAVQQFLQESVRLTILAIPLDINELYLTLAYIFGAQVPDQGVTPSSPLSSRPFYSSGYQPKQRVSHSIPPTQYSLNHNDSNHHSSAATTYTSAVPEASTSSSSQVYINTSKKLAGQSYFQLQNIQYFGEQRGFEAIHLRLQQGEGGATAILPLNGLTIIHMLHALTECRSAMDEKWWTEYMSTIRQLTFSYFLSLDDDYIKSINRKVVARAMQQLDVILQPLFTQTDIRQWFEVFDLTFGLKLLKCSYLDKVGIHTPL